MNFGTPFGKSLAGGGAAFPADAPGYLFNDGLGGLSWDAAATPEAAGADKQIQFNDVGTMGANENLTFDKSTNTLSISGNSYNILSIGTDSKNFFEGFIWAGSDTLTEYRYSTSKLQVISHNVIDTNSIGYGDTQAAVFSAKGTGSVAGISVYAQTSGAELATRSRNMIGALGYDATDAVIQNLFGAWLLADTGDASGELIGIQATAQGMVIAPVTATVTSEIGVEAIHGGFAFDGTYTVLETYGIKISLNPAADVGAVETIGDNYGLYIDDHSVRPVTGSHYNLYSAGANSKNYFQGNVEIDGDLDVSTGFISISGSDNQVLFNDSGVIGGTNNFTYDNILGKLALSWSGATGESENREIFALSATRTDGGGIDHGGYSDELCALNITTEATTPDTTQYGIKITLSADGQGVGENEESKLYGIESHCGLNNCINPSACAGVFNTQVRDCTYGSNWNSALEVSANVSARFDDCTSDGQGLSVGCGMTAYSNNTLTASLLKGSRYVFDIGAIYGGVINLTEAAFITTEALLECGSDASNAVTIGTFYGIKVCAPELWFWEGPPINSTYTVSNLYGIYIEDHTAIPCPMGGTLLGSVRYNLYSAGYSSKNLFQGTLYLEKNIGGAKTFEVVGVITKTDTGDPAYGYEGLICINTFDNTVKVYGDGGWRTIASGW
jgi:hypothetical protein